MWHAWALFGGVLVLVLVLVIPGLELLERSRDIKRSMFRRFEAAGTKNRDSTLKKCDNFSRVRDKKKRYNKGNSKDPYTRIISPDFHMNRANLPLRAQHKSPSTNINRHTGQKI